MPFPTDTPVSGADGDPDVCEEGRSPPGGGLRRRLESMHESLQAASGELAGCRLEAERLRQRVSGLEQEHRRVCEEHAALQTQVAELGSLYVVMERIHGTVDPLEVRSAVQDIVINVIGSEEVALFQLSERSGELVPTQCFGVEARGLGPVPLGSGILGRAAAERRSWMLGDGPPPPDHPELSACVPLVAADRVVGVLAIWRMLAHRPAFGPADRRVLDVVAEHAARALYLTSLPQQPLRADLP